MTAKEEKILKEQIEKIARNVIKESKEERLNNLIESSVREALLKEADDNERNTKKKSSQNIEAKKKIVMKKLQNDDLKKAEVIRNALHKTYEKGSSEDNTERSEYSKKIRGERPFDDKEVTDLYNYLTNGMHL